MTLSLDTITESVQDVSRRYPVKKVILFGSYAEGTCTEESDVDLLVEFQSRHVSLFVLSGLKLSLEEMLDKQVDILHAPLPDDTMIETGKGMVVYES